MAAKTTKLNSKEFELGSDLDFPNLDFDYGEPKKDSHPVLTTLKAIGKGAVGSVFNRSLIRSTIKNSLPDVYGQAYDFYDQAKESVRSLYNDAAKELRPATTQLKQTTQRFLPQAEGILSKEMAQKVKDWSKSGTSSGPSLSPDRVRDDALAMQIGEIFKAQAEDTDRKEQRAEKRELLTEGVTQIRHRDILGGLSAIDQGVSRLAQYQDTVLANYQKKSLELQFRQYYVMADLLNESKRAHAATRYQLEAIVKNTGLPDYAKLSTSAALKQAVRNKFLEVGNNALFGGGGGADFIKNFIGNLKKSAAEKLKGGTDGINGLADILDVAGSVGDMGDLGPSKHEMAGEFVGQGVGALAKWFGQKKLKERLDKSPGVQKGAEHLQYNLNNAANRFSDALTNPNKEWSLRNARGGLANMLDKNRANGRSPGVRGWLADKLAPADEGMYDFNGPGMLETLRETLAAHLPSNAPDTKLDQVGLLGQSQPAIYSNAAQKSIIEVIPGMLARIHRELVVTRTGQDQGLISYDFKANKFSTQKAVSQGIRASLAGEANRKQFDDRLNQIISEVDKEGKLTEDQVKGVKDVLARMSIKRESTDATNLVKDRTWASVPGGEEVAKLFQQHLQTDTAGKRDGSLEGIRAQRILSDRVSGLSKYFDDPRAQLQAMASLGQTSAINQSGLYNAEKGSLDLDKIAGALRGRDPDMVNEDDTYVPVGDGGRRPNQARRALEARRRGNLRQAQPQAPAAAPIPEAPKPKVVEALAAPQVVKFDAKDFITALQAQTDEIKKLDHGDLFRSMVTQLEAINAHLAEGINTYSLAEDYLGSGARAKYKDKLGRLKDRAANAAGRLKDKASDLADKAKEKLGKGKEKVQKSLEDVTLGDIGSGALGAVRFGAKSLFKTGKRVATLAGGVAKNVAAVGIPLIASGTQKLADMFGDVYLPGEKDPRITRGDMKAGIYFDKASGKKITSFKDMTGAVVDEAGNIILDEAQVKVAYVKGNRTKSLIQAVSEAGGAIKSLAGFALGLVGGGYNLALRAAITGFHTVRAMLPPYDVYVKTNMETPKLRKSGFVDRKYISKKSGKTLTHPREIDGVVLDEDGNQLITQEDFDTGLVDVKGVTIKGPGRLLGKAKALGAMAMRGLKGLAGNAKEFLVGIGQAMKDLFGGVFGLRGEYLQTSMKQLDVQTAILKLLTERMPAKKKHTLGDVDGDGVREGSAQQMELFEKKQDEERKAKQDVDPRGKAGADAEGGGAGGGLLAKMKSLFARKKEGEDDGKGESLLDEAGDAANIYDSVRGRGGKAAAEAEKAAGKVGRFGKFGRALGGLGKGLKFGLKGLGLAGAAYGAYSAYDNLKQGNYGSAAVDAGLSAVGAAGTLGGLGGIASLGSGALATGGAVLEGGAALAGGAGSLLAAGATGLLGILTAPITLTALGVAAVGAAAYYGYKYLTRVTLKTLSTVRYAQYGVAASDSQDHLAPIWDLEKLLEPITKVDDGKASFDQSKFDMDQCMKIFKVEKASDQVKPWVSWFTNRFKPVFFAHIATLRGKKPGVELHDVDSDKLTAQEKTDYLAATSMPGGPYDYLASPFADQKNLAVASDGVKSAIDIAQDQLKKDLANEKANPKTKAAVAPAAAVGAAATGKAAASSLTAGAKSAMGTAAGAAAVSPADAAAAKAASDLGGTVPTESTNKEAGVNLIAGNTVPSDYLFTGQTGRIDALSSIRYKTYGLVEMDVDKIKQIRYLEMNVMKVLKIGKDGATYDEDIEALLNQVKGVFGITGPHSPEGLAWMKWFRNRFLPVYLNYATMVTKLTGKKDLVSGEMSLTPQMQIDTANAVYTTSSVVDGSKISVWKVSDTPWKGYALNDDPATVQANLQFLTEAVKAVKANEQMSTKIKDAQRENEKKGAAMGTSASQTDTAKDPTTGKTDIIQRDKSSVEKDTAKLAGGVGFSQSLPLSPDGKGVRAIGDFTKGTPIEHPGKGTGGDINSLPQPSGDGYEGMKDMLAAVAKMTGAPLQSLITTAAVESGFRASAMPPVNPATGKRASGAVGLFQFIPSTWNAMMSKYAAKYGIAPGTPPTDPRANALLGAEFLKENLTSLQGRLKKPITSTDLYLAHFLGAGGAAQFLNSDPTAIAAEAMPKAAAANPTIFYDTKRNNAPRTFAEIYGLFTEKINRETKKYGVTDTAASSAPTATDVKKDTKGQVTGDPTTNPATASTPAAGQGQKGAPVTATATPDKPVAAAVDPNAPKSQAATGAAALVNSSTAAGTAAGSSSGSGYGGSIAAVTQPAGAATPDTTPAATPTPAVPVAPVVKPPVSGYQGYRPRLQPTADEIAAQHAATAAATGGDIKGIGATLIQSLDVQTKSLTQLTLMAQMLGKLGSLSVSSAAPASNDATKTPSPIDIPRPPPRAPVSMARGG